MKITIHQFKQNLVKIQDDYRAKYPDCKAINFIFADAKTGRTATLWNDFFGLGFDLLWLPTLDSVKKKSQITVVAYEDMNEEIETEGNIYNFKGRKMELKISITFDLEGGK